MSEFDKNGNITKTTDPVGDAVQYTYNAYGDIILESYADNNNRISQANPEGRICTYTYDAVGNITGVKDALEKVNGREYDLKGQLTKITDANGNTRTMT